MDRGNRLVPTVKIHRHSLHPQLFPLRRSLLVREHNRASALQW
jgi:hypothetical protein